MELGLRREMQERMALRSYTGNEERRILDFLNLCYGAWGNLDEWKWRNVEYPTFEDDNIVIAELNGDIVGHGALFFRNLYMPNIGALCTSTLGDAGVHPEYRGKGVYSRITYETRIPIAKSKGAALLFLHMQKGSLTHKANRKRGFIEIHYPVYIKIINGKKVLMAELTKYIQQNEDLKRLQFGNINIHLNDTGILVSIGEKRKNDSKCGRVEIVVNEASLPLLIGMKVSGRVKAVIYFLALLLFRKLKLRISPTVSLLIKAIRWSLGFVSRLHT